MSDQHSLVRHWPLLLVTVLLSSAFAIVFLVSVNQAKAARSAELSLDTGRALSVPEKGLTFTTQLGTLRPDTPQPRKPSLPAPWWPALLFSLAFFCGWLFRNAARRHDTVVADSQSSVNEQESLQTSVNSIDQEYIFSPGKDAQDSEEQTPNLAIDFPWDETLLDNGTPLSSEERIARLEKQNASKVEIIKALERLVAENREKWLHQDETEARLDKHIRDLSDDLHLAVRLLHQLHAEPDLPESKALKSIV